MKYILLIILSIATYYEATSQEKVITYYQFNYNGNNVYDSAFFIQALINNEVVSFKTINQIDSLNKADTSYNSLFAIHQTVIGPYKFRKKKKNILYIKYGKWKKYRQLFSLRESYFFSPDVFSDDPNVVYKTKYAGDDSVVASGKVVKCYKFIIEDRAFDGNFRIVFLDKSSLLPIKIEYYKDADLKNCYSIIKANGW